MNALGIALMWCFVQVTVLSIVVGGLYLIARRLLPAAGVPILLTGLGAVVVLSALALSPWPQWVSCAQPVSVDDNSVALVSENLPVGPSVDSSTEPPSSSTARQDPRHRERPPAKIANLARKLIEGISSLSTVDPASGICPAVVVGWVILTAMVCGCGWLTLGIVAVRRQRLRSPGISDKELCEEVDVLCAELSCLRAVEIRQCDELTSAATIGWRQPVLLLPGDWKNWTTEQRRAVLAHEIAHVRGRDFLALLFGQLGLALHFYHPLLHWLTNRMRLEQELAADAAAARISGGQRQYLTTIAELALHQTERPLFWPARTFLPTQNTFLRRIAMLRNTKIRFERLSPYSRLIAVGTVLLCGFAVSGLRGPVSQGRVLADDAQGNQSVAKAVEISAVANQPTESQKVIGYVGESSADYRSFADSGFAVEYERPEGMNSVSAVKIFSARYGHPQAPNEDFHIYLLDGNKKVLEDIRVPYRKVEQGELQWNTFRFPAVQVPEKFYVALWFNAQRTKGVYVGMDKNVSETHSFAGLPDKGYEKVEENYEWMIRAAVSSETGKTPSNPKVKTYEEEKAADTESTEAASDESGSETPTRTWNDATGTFSMEAQFLGVSDGKVNLKKADGKLVEIPLDKLSQEDRDFVANHANNMPKMKSKAPAGAGGKQRELSHDDGKMASKSSIAGGGHAVKFQVDSDSHYVTSVSLHGSRYGEVQPPDEDFNVWICDEHFKPLATFHFPYSSYTRSAPAWKNFRIEPTKVPQKFIVCFGFNPEATKGVFVSYDAQGSGYSLIGLPEQGEPKPFGKGDWLIRCKVEKREKK